MIATRATVKAAEWVINMTDAAKKMANEIKLELLNISDEDLLAWSNSIFSDGFKTITEHIESEAKKHRESMPF